MPFSAGIFSRVYNWATEQLSPPIEISKLDDQENDFATGLSNCILRDGTGIPTADQDWNGKKITNLGGLVVSDGTAGAPSIGFFSDTDTGLYRGGTNNLNFATGGARILNMDTNGIYFNDGVVALPAISFFNDPDTGIFRSGANKVGITTGGTQRLDISAIFDATGCTNSYFADGTALAPSLSFGSDQDIGAYRVGANQLGIATGGLQSAAFASGLLTIGAGFATGQDRLFLANSGVRSASNLDYYFNISGTTLQIYGYDGATTAVGSLQLSFLQVKYADGSAGAPSLAFTSDTDTGLYRGGANDLRVAAGGAAVAVFDSTGVSAFTAIKAGDGSAASPGIRFINDVDTGLFLAGANEMRAVGGAQLGSRWLSTGSQHYAVDGSAADPAYQFASDADTGIYRAGANQIGISAGGGVVALFSSALPVFSLSGGVTTGNSLASIGMTSASGTAVALAINGPSGPFNALSLSNFNATGASTPTLGTNKPGSNSSVAGWIPILVDGAQRYIPFWS